MPINSTSLYSIPSNRSEPVTVKKASVTSDSATVAEPRQILPVDGNNVSPVSQPKGLQEAVAKAEKQEESDTESISQAVSDINEFVQIVNRDLEFTVDKELGETIIKVIDRETEEVVRQIPSKEVLELARHLKELEDSSTGGFLIEVKA